MLSAMAPKPIAIAHSSSLALMAAGIGSILNTAGTLASASTRMSKVIKPFDGMRGGNWLYYWQLAALRSRRWRSVLVDRQEGMDEWLDEFPLLDRLTTPGHARTARKLFPISFGRDFTAEENRGFCRDLACSSQSFRDRLEKYRRLLTPRTVVVNVRRGDYYSNPEFARRFAIDICHHVEQSFDILEACGRNVDSAVLVSDDIEWTLTNVSRVLPVPAQPVPDRTSMFDDLAALAASSQQVLANSTFSYWGAHLASALNNECFTIAPHHHEAGGGYFETRMFDPRWVRTGYSPPHA